MAAAENRKDADGNVCGARLIFVFTVFGTNKADRIDLVR